MTSIFTPAVLTTVTSATLAGSLSLTAILVLLALLAEKELASAVAGGRSRRFAQVLNIAIPPLLLVLLLVLLVRIAEGLR